eukprot:1909463-Rhodomonas_salina.3
MFGTQGSVSEPEAHWQAHVWELLCIDNKHHDNILGAVTVREKVFKGFSGAILAPWAFISGRETNLFETSHTHSCMYAKDACPSPHAKESPCSRFEHSVSCTPAVPWPAASTSSPPH